MSRPWNALSVEEKRLAVARLVLGRDAQAGPDRRVWTSPRRPLSPNQARLRALALLNPDSSALHIAGGVRLSGPLNLPALRRAVDALLARHEALRTSVAEDDEGPYAFTHPPSTVPLVEHDLSALTGADHARALAERLDTFARAPFVLSAPLARALLIRLAPDEHALAFALHHLISDGASLAALSGEFLRLYEHLTRGAPDPLPPNPLQQGDHAAWMCTRQQAGAWSAVAEARAKALDGVSASVDWPPPSAGASGTLHVPFVLGPDETSWLFDRARALGLTPYMAFLAGLGLWVRRLTGAESLMVGSPVAARTRPELEAVHGYLTNTLLLPLALVASKDAPGLTCAAWLMNLRAAVLDAMSAPDLPLAEVAARFAAQGRPLAPPPVLFAFRHTPPPPAHIAGLGLTPLALPPPDTQAAVTLDLVYDGGRVNGLLSVDAALVREDVARSAPALIVGLLRACLEAPDAPLETLALPEVERARCRAAGQGGPAGGRGQTLLHVIAEHAARRPDATAILSDAVCLSYADLHRETARLAAALLATNPSPEDRVVVWAGPGHLGVLSILGVMRAGLAFVPIDPMQPVARAARMIQDSGARLALCASASPHPALPGLLWLEAGEIVGHGPAPALPWAPVTPGQLAYVIFTSGSTGAPKGVMVEHRGLSNHAVAVSRHLGMTEGVRVFQFASLGFDAAAWDIALALGAGGTLVVAEGKDRPWPGGELEALLARHQVEQIMVPPSALAVMEPKDAPSLRRILAGGEALPLPVARRWAGAVELWNAYGPTEITICATMCRVAPNAAEITIGEPLPGYTLAIRDSVGAEVPWGGVGELWIGGDCVARGYAGGVGDERFVSDPGGARRYRTGDLARWSAGGGLLFLGRADGQVKIHGHRVELTEVEAALLRQPGVRGAVARARPGPDGGLRLLAWVTGEDIQIPAIRAALTAELPPYLRPSRLMALPNIARTPSGKVDDAALPEPNEEAEQANDEPPASALESKLAKIMGAVLGVTAIGRHQSYFTLGGDSIASVRLASRATRAGLPVEPRDLYAAPTVATLAELVAARLGTAPRQQSPDRVIYSDTVVQLNGVQRWFFELGLPNPDHWAMATVVAVAPGLTVEALGRALTALINRHDALRTRFVHTDDGVVAELPPNTPPPVVNEVSTVGLRPRVAEARARGALSELIAGLSLAEPPLIAAALIRGAAELGGDRLALVAHHAAMDVVSWAVVLDELEALLALEDPGPAGSAAVWSRAWEAQTFGPAEQAWLTQNQDGTVWPSLPPGAERDARTLSFEVPAGGRAGAEAWAWLLAGGAEAARRSLGLDAWAVHVETQGRARLGEVEPGRAIGWFTARVPLVFRASAEGDLAATARAVRAQLSALPAEGALLQRQPLEHVGALINFLGELRDGLPGPRLLRTLPLPAVALRDPDGPRPYALEVDAARVGETLWVRLTGAGAMGAALDTFAAAWARALQAEEGFPLPAAAMGMLFHGLAEPGAYVPQLLLVPEQIERGELPDALRAVMAAEPALRMGVRTLRGVVEGFVAETVDLPLRTLDLRELADPEATLAEALREERERPFDLAQPPALRALIVLREGRWELVLTVHHLILDGWSLPLLLGRISEAVRALRAGRGEIPPGPSFPDLARALARVDLSQDVAAVLGLLGDAPLPGPPLLAGPPPGQALASRRPEHGARLGAEAQRALAQLMARARVSLGTVVLAAWAEAIRPYTGAGDAVIGLAVAGRDPSWPGGERMLGPLLNTLPMRIPARGDQRVEDWLAAIQDRLLSLLPHARAPLPQVLAGAGAGRGLVDSLVVIESYPQPPEVKGPRLRLVAAVEETHARLTLTALPGAELGLALSYDARSVGAEAARALLNQVIAQVERLVTPELAHPQILTLLDGGPGLAPQGQDLIDTLLNRLDAAPEALAVIDALGSLTRGQLKAAVEGLVEALAERGVGPGDLVAAALPRDRRLPILTLAVLARGAVWMPLPTAGPPARLALAFERHPPALFVCAESAQDASPKGPWPRLILGAQALITKGPSARVRLVEGPATLILTSGSTGRPKGVLGRRAALANHAAAIVAQWGIGPHDRAAAFAGPEFDVSLEELLPTLLAGAAVVMLTEEARLDPERLVAELAQHTVTILNIASSVWHRLVDRGVVLPKTIRLVIVGNEAPDHGRLPAFFALHPGLRLVNAYGPTESTITALTYEVPQALPEGGGVPIGRPLPGLVAKVIGADGEAPPLGAPGELWLGGLGLALGYAGDPESTARAFVTDGDGARWYRTGDRVRVDANGDVHFLGRVDAQVKVRGQRIELGEVEAALAAAPGVREAAAGLRPGDEGLTAWVVFDRPVERSALVGSLRERLTPAMIPSVFRRLSALPRTGGGKVDRAALADLGERWDEPLGRAPTSTVEEALAQIWAAALRRPEVGATEDFFDLGGTSLDAVVVFAAARERFGRAPPLASLMAARTVAAQARLLQADQGLLCRLSAEDAGGLATVFVPSIGGGALVYRELAAALPGPVYALESPLLAAPEAPLTPGSLLESYAAALHETFGDRPVRLIGWSLGGSFAVALGASLAALGRPVAGVVLLDAVPRSTLTALRLDHAEDPVEQAHLNLLAAMGPLLSPGCPITLVRAARTWEAAWAPAALAVWRALGALRLPEPVNTDHEGLLRGEAAAQVAALLSV